MERNHLYVLIAIIVSLLIVIQFYNKKKKKDIVEGFYEDSDFKVILKAPILLIKAFISITMIPCMIMMWIRKFFIKMLDALA